MNNPQSSYNPLARVLRLLTVLALSALVAGCSWFSWIPGVGGGDEEEESLEPAKLVSFTAELDIDREWKIKVGEGLGKKYVRVNPGVVADRIIAADAYGSVVAVDRFTGKRIWQTQFDQAAGKGFGLSALLDRSDPSFVSGGIGIGEGLALLGTTRGEVVALSVADGSEMWRSNVGTEIGSTPVTADDRVFVQSIDGKLTALDSESGEGLWTYNSQVPRLTLRGTSSPVVANDVVYTGFASGKVSALRVENGEPIWEQRIMLPEGRSELERIVDVDASPLIAAGALFAVAYQGRAIGMSLRDGRPRWERDSSSFLNMAEGYGQLYIVDDEDTITAIDQNTGDVVWQQEAFARRKLTAPLAFSNYIFVGDDEGYLHAIAQRDGRLLGRIKVGGKGLRSNLIVVDGVVYASDNKGTLHAFKAVLR
jgi:outer membrane protein assembly factor BamB